MALSSLGTIPERFIGMEQGRLSKTNAEGALQQ
jgi:hypothetical protein